MPSSRPTFHLWPQQTSRLKVRRISLKLSNLFSVQYFLPYIFEENIFLYISSKEIYFYSRLSLDFPVVHFGEVLRTCISQPKRRSLPIVSQHHDRSGKGIF